MVELESEERYTRALKLSIDWLHRSVDETGGSRAYFGAWGQWSRSYPETSGYIIPTLLRYSNRFDDRRSFDAAVDLGRWLLEIQSDEGYWHGGLHPPDQPNPSVFNTAQILLGLVALQEEDDRQDWLSAAERGAQWLARGVTEQGKWENGNFVSNYNPAYYTRVAWPILAVWEKTEMDDLCRAAEKVLQRIIKLRTKEGGFLKWGFRDGEPAPTHTVAYTLRGLLESAEILGSWKPWGEAAEEALERLYRHTGLCDGHLPGAYMPDWTFEDHYTCPTGNAQLAICFLKYHEREEDPRLIDASCKLIDNVCSAQSQSHVLNGIKGAIPGSNPIWGGYRQFRYPNWAAKFFCDSIMKCLDDIGNLKKMKDIR